MKLLDQQSCWIIIHFGINPVKGGRPPSESKDMNTASLVTGEGEELIIKWLKWKVWVKWNKRTTDKDITEYTMKYTNHVLSLMSNADIIHAIWLIEEYPSSLRIRVWLRPPIAPTTADIITAK